MAKIEKLVEEMAAPICEARGLRVYDVEYKKEGPDWFLRVFLYGEGGVLIEDCEAVSRALSDVLDEKDPIEAAYCLEVSSPGIERVLSRDWHFETALGELVEARLYAPLDGKKTLTGILKNYNKETITVETEDGADVTLPMDKVGKVQTLFDGNF